MTRETVWRLLQEGYNAAEIAAAAGVCEDVAHSMIDEAMGRTRGATIRHLDRLTLHRAQELAA